MGTSNNPFSEKKQKGKRKTRQKGKKQKRTFHIFSVFFKSLLAIGIFTGVAAIGIAGGTLYGYIDTVEELNIRDLQLNHTSFVYYLDPETNEPVELERLHAEENHIWVSLDEIPKDLINAYIAIEDERFMSHPGVDFKRTFGATFNYFVKRDSSYGGSTITQQLIKNITGEDDATPDRKIQEMWRALQLEKELSKEQILEYYLNIIYLGRGCNGVQTAANTYFNKDVGELTLAEAASIAGITQHPARFDPFISPENNKQKQRLVLGKMLELGYIDEVQYQQAKQDELIFQRGVQQERISRQSYFVDQVIEDVLDDLVKEKGYSRQVASRLLYTGGLKIHATIDPSIQDIMDRFFTDEEFWRSNLFANFPEDEYPDASMLIMDPFTGQVKGMVGGIGEKTAKRTLNRATQTKRQPGSSIKPLSVYAPAVEYGLVTLASVIDDVPYIYNEGKADEWFPTNYGGINDFRGLTNVRVGMELSRNTLAIKALEMLGVNRSFDFLQNNLGISSLIEREQRADGRIYTDKGLSSLALGGFTDGVSVMEMTAAYTPFANRGIYTKPYSYTKVLDRDGNVVLEKQRESHIAMSEQTAFLIGSTMEGVVRQGTATIARLSNNMSAAGKTGTTSDFIDKWFVGYTPYYVGGVWYGFDEPKNMQTLSNNDLGRKPNPGAVAWQKIMDEIHAQLEAKSFTQPSNIVRVAVCRDSGMKPSEYSYHDPRGSRVYTEYFKTGTEPRHECTVHVREKVCTLNNLLATEYTPPELVAERVFIIRPEPYIPVLNRWGTPIMPHDAQHEFPAGEYCNEFGPPEEEDESIYENRENYDLDLLNEESLIH